MARHDLTAYKRLWLLLNALWDEGRGDSPEADALRDAGDGPWQRMDDDDKRAFSEWVRNFDPA